MPGDSKKAAMFDSATLLAGFKKTLSPSGIMAYLEYLVFQRKSDVSLVICTRLAGDVCSNVNVLDLICSLALRTTIIEQASVCYTWIFLLPNWQIPLWPRSIHCKVRSSNSSACMPSMSRLRTKI